MGGRWSRLGRLSENPVMTRHPALVEKLEREGYFAFADYVRNGWLPGRTVAMLSDIEQYAARLDMPKIAEMIRQYDSIDAAEGQRATLDA